MIGERKIEVSLRKPKLRRVKVEGVKSVRIINAIVPNCGLKFRHALRFVCEEIFLMFHQSSITGRSFIILLTSLYI